MAVLGHNMGKGGVTLTPKTYFWGLIPPCHFGWKMIKKCDHESADIPTDRNTLWHRQTEFIICPMLYTIAMGQIIKRFIFGPHCIQMLKPQSSCWCVAQTSYQCPWNACRPNAWQPCSATECFPVPQQFLTAELTSVYLCRGRRRIFDDYRQHHDTHRDRSIVSANNSKCLLQLDHQWILLH